MNPGRGLVAWLFVASLVAACAAPVQSVTTAAGSPESPQPRAAQPTSNPCVIVIRNLGTYTQRLADDLSVLRPLVVAKRFDLAATVSSVREASSTVTEGAGLRRSMESCGGADVLQTALGAVEDRAKAAMDRAFAGSINDAQRVREGAVQLLAVLPDVVALSEAGSEYARTFGTDVPAVEVVDEAAQPVGDLPPLVTERPRSTPTPDTAAKRVKLPKLSVAVKGAKAIKYFSIAGDVPNELSRSMNRRADKHCSDDAAACVHLDMDPDFSYRRDPQTGSCRITGVRWRRDFTVYVPRWTKPERVYPAALAWWRKVLDHIAWHEGQHIKIQNRHLAKLKTDLVGESCERGQKLINRWMARARRAQSAFDAKDRSWQPPVYAGPRG
jgi:predicted secreted Zn-dependent protease